MFEVSAKVDYGLLILLELAKTGTNDYQALADIAAKHNVSPKFLSQVIIPLKQHGLVTSREGKRGGYKLARPLAVITLRALVEAMDGPLQLVRCMTDTKLCPAEQACSTKPVWQKLKLDIYQLLDRTTLHDLYVRD
ncbi:MAG: Rrf2 family transcriptional regulator [Candidatus Kerfeldbacteria bacterium]|nr:Rrf2 family transcriptional regulator [Candidatus Kerfeldbacteria bacterium]